ncbi:hypothetical protein [Bacillus phage vB_BanS-Thrax2]|nr:hypothetical protein [Bacillus phage vB_BanS-Thrax2]
MKKILGVLGLSALLLAGCSQGDSMRFTDDPQAYTKTDGEIETYIMIDTYTNCKYVIFNWYNGGGASPLLDKEGKPMCGKD